jgi:hypothetical protein
MLFKRNRLHKEEEGSAILIFILSFFLIIGASGLAIDVGFVYKAKSDLRKAANSAALSGVQEVMNGEAPVRGVVGNILRAHGEEKSLKELIFRPDNQNKVKVILEKDVPTHFMKIFKINNIKTSVDASAGVAPLVRAAGAVPLGIDKNTKLEYRKEYKLKVDAGGSIAGSFGVLALSGVGSNLYEQDLMYGFNSEIKIGDIIGTQTGNIEGKTRSAVNFRINSSPYPTDDLSHRDDPRVIMILIYEPYESATNQLKSVKICGFAYFYLRQPMSNQDSSITGYFIQRVGSGVGDVNSKDNGAYAIRLVE